MARKVVKHVYAAERLQLPTSLGVVLGTYGTLWARARSVGYWREVVRSGEFARLSVYAVERTAFSRCVSLESSFFFLFLGLIVFFLFGRSVRSWDVGRSWGIMCSRAGRVRRRNGTLFTTTNHSYCAFVSSKSHDRFDLCMVVYSDSSSGMRNDADFGVSEE